MADKPASGRGQAVKKASDNTAAGAVPQLTAEDLAVINSRKGLLKLLSKRNIKIKSILREIAYEEELKLLQAELNKLHRSVQEQGRRIVIIFEGRDAAGKGGAIRRFSEHLSPRGMRIIAMPKPSDLEKGQWYFQRYINALPNRGEIRFFDRSWYNRAVVEPVMGFCTEDQYTTYMRQVPEFEHMLYEEGIEVVKFWFSITKEEQKKRFEDRARNPLKQWKLSPIDARAQEMWDDYTRYKEEMFARTHTAFSPWVIVKANNKNKARLESIRHVLATLDYAGKGDAAVSLMPDPDVVMRYHRDNKDQD